MRAAFSSRNIHWLIFYRISMFSGVSQKALFSNPVYIVQSCISLFPLLSECCINDVNVSMHYILFWCQCVWFTMQRRLNAAFFGGAVFDNSPVVTEASDYPLVISFLCEMGALSGVKWKLFRYRARNLFRSFIPSTVTPFPHPYSQ